MAKQSKQRRDVAVRYDKAALYPPRDALELVKSLAFGKFDESVDAAFQLGIDPRKAEQNVRGTVSLPNGTGKEVRVLVFAESDKAREAEAAGADVVGGKELAAEISGGRALDFDIAIATPDLMSEVGKLGPILGPRGLMPNPKSGTVTFDVGKAVEAFKAGRVEYRNDRYGNVHVPVGRVSFDGDQLEENLAAVADELVRQRPAAAKGRYIRKVALSSTMGVGVHVDPSSIEGLIKAHR
jgi:large subunit ribosomal protein L1